MTIEFDSFNTEIQSDEFVDERVSNEELEAADEFYNELEFELNDLELELDDLNFEIGSGLDALEEETRLADAEWDEHRQLLDMELLGSDGEFHNN